MAFSGESQVKLVAFATYDEAEESIKALKATSLKEGTLYQFPKGFIAITGIGSLAASHAVAKILFENPSIEEIWNFGFAGALCDHLPIGTIRAVNMVGKHLSIPSFIDHHSQQFASTLQPPFQLHSEGLKLITSDYPIHSDELRTTLSPLWDAVDMEGYGIAYAAQRLGRPCHLYKIISDFSKPGGHLLIIKGKKMLSEALATLLFDSLTNKN